jgi:cysteinyl-tRNA synthetase
MQAVKLMHCRLHTAQAAFRAALCDSFNTPDALAVLRELVSKANVYAARGRAHTDVAVLERVARWVGAMLRMFGLGEGAPEELGWGEARAEGEVANVSAAGQRTCGAC